MSDDKDRDQTPAPDEPVEGTVEPREDETARDAGTGEESGQRADGDEAPPHENVDGESEELVRIRERMAPRYSSKEVQPASFTQWN